MANVIIGNGDAAVSSWQEGEVDPHALIGLGQKAQTNGQWNSALLFYKGAVALERVQPNEGRFLAGGVCQGTLAQPDVLSPVNQRYCPEYFSQNDNNLILNGQFDEGNTWGWSGQFFFSDAASAAYRVDSTAGKPPPSVSIAGVTEARHHGLFQRVALRPGMAVRYSAWARVQSTGRIEARLLYIGWRQHEEPQGNQLQVVSGDMEWTYLERTFRLPDDSEADVRFYPVILTGQGVVWVDDVRLELLSE